jgi:hypothetical protein
LRAPNSFANSAKENIMNRPSILGIAAMTALGLAVLPSSVAQQNSLREQLLGTWTLVSSDQVRPDGSRLQQFGAKPTGVNVFGANGPFLS